MSKKQKDAAPAAAPDENRREAPPMIGPADHPRAAALIRRAKGWGGMAGFGLTALASTLHGSPGFDVVLRSLLGGIVGWVVAWMVAVSVSRSLLKAQGQLAIERVLEHRRKQLEAAAAAAANAEAR